jgi:uncharacterized protein YeaO (DUF488 family)
MPIRVVQLGTPRAEGEGLRLGTVRRPPRGVRKDDYARRDYFDVWLPDLAPSAPLVRWVLSEPLTPARWARFSRKYRQEMRAPAPQRLLQLLAALSSTTNLSVGCYCDDEARCHRSLLRELLKESGAEIVSNPRSRLLVRGNEHRPHSDA